MNVDIINRFRLLTSRDYNHFYIQFHSPNGVCDVLNILQSEVFEINTNVLLFILNNRDLLEEVGLLLPKNLLKVNLQEASDLLRSCYFNDQVVKDVCSCNVLLTQLVKRVQRARYEEFILTIANAYSGYQFDLPAFMDFRGRIYRSGVLHFHERDLAKSVILFSSDAQSPELSKCEDSSLKRDLLCAAAFFNYTLRIRIRNGNR